MIYTRIDGIKVSGMAAAVSGTWESIEDLARRVGEDDPAFVEKFIKNSAVKGRYSAGLYQTTSDFCFAAAKKVLEEKRINPKEIGALVFVTQTADYRIPATACLLQDRLGLSRDCMAFDVNLGCSGFTYGINIVASLMNSSNVERALLLCGDTSAKERTTRLQSKQSHSAKFLFGDAGTATLLEKFAGGGGGRNRSISSPKRTGAATRRSLAPMGAGGIPIRRRKICWMSA